MALHESFINLKFKILSLQFKMLKTIFFLNILDFLKLVEFIRTYKSKI